MCFRHVIKDLVHAFSCAYIELWMHLESLKRALKKLQQLSAIASWNCLPSRVCNLPKPAFKKSIRKALFAALEGEEDYIETPKLLSIINFYTKACYRPKTVAHPLAGALLEYPVTCNYARLLTQTTVLDKSGHDCGKFNHIKCNRIPTQRSILKLFRSN